MDASCGFCTAVAEGTLLALRAHTAVIADAHPINPGHALVTPIRHAASLVDLDEDETAELMLTAREVDLVLREAGLAPDGVWVHLADGAGQDVQHVHLHVIPRVPGDGLDLVEGGTPAARDAAIETDLAARLAETD